MVKRNILLESYVKAFHYNNHHYRIFSDSLSSKILTKNEMAIIDSELISSHVLKLNNHHDINYIMDNLLAPNILVREQYIKKHLNNFRIIGGTQFISLYNGYDTTFYNNPNFIYYMVEEQKVIDSYQLRLKKANILTHNVSFISDKSWLKQLEDNGYNKNKKTIVKILGIIDLLSEEELDSIFHNLSNILSFSSEIIIDFSIPNNFINSLLDKYNFIIYELLDKKVLEEEYLERYNILNPDHKMRILNNYRLCLVIKR